MLFHSYEFALVFLPLCLLGAALLARLGVAWALGGLLLASLVFYGWDEPLLVGMLLGSVAFNFALGFALDERDTRSAVSRRRLLWLGIAANLGLLCQFKYTNFGIEIWNALAGGEIAAQPMILPLAISFFTFQQIAYLVDVHRGESAERSPLRYGLFVCFFPQLIAGPIVHHREILPQLARPGGLRIGAEGLSVGGTLFILGLFKKVVLADGVALWADPVFAAAAAGTAVGFADAWGGALAYSFQLYFDFSGYCDMAVGLAAMFGVRLPFNFDSPYQATSIADFWRRWHMTLSRFLRDYLYVPLGGNRLGRARRYANLFVTMLLGGLWHGAGWTFVLWGGLHGLYLVVNHGWRAWRPAGASPADRSNRSHWPGRVLTFVAVVAAWVLFRADSLEAATSLYAAMLGLHGLGAPGLEAASLFGGRQVVFGPLQAAALALLLAGVWALPNSQQFMGLAPRDGASPRPFAVTWTPSPRWAAWAALLVLASLVGMSQAAEFVYFRF